MKFRLENEKIGNGSDISPVQVSPSVHDRSGQPDETTIELGDPLFADSGRAPLNSEIPEWLQEFRGNLVDDEIPVHGDSHASSSNEASLDLTFKRSEDLGKHSVYTHFPKDRNCEIFKKDQNYKGPMQKTQWRNRASC